MNDTWESLLAEACACGGGAASKVDPVARDQRIAVRAGNRSGRKQQRTERQGGQAPAQQLRREPMGDRIG